MTSPVQWCSRWHGATLRGRYQVRGLAERRDAANSCWKWTRSARSGRETRDTRTLHHFITKTCSLNMRRQQQQSQTQLHNDQSDDENTTSSPVSYSWTKNPRRNQYRRISRANFLRLESQPPVAHVTRADYSMNIEWIFNCRTWIIHK